MSDEALIELAKRFKAYAIEDHMTKKQFKSMMGILGETYFATRMFDVMDEDSTGKITLGQYLDFNDIMMHGTEEEKKKQNYRMLDIKGEGIITYESFEEFIFNILDMYHQTLSQKVETERESIKKKFYEISGGKDILTYADYSRALDKNPRLFDWLERPKEMVNDILNEKMYEKETMNKLLSLVYEYIANTKIKLSKARNYTPLDKSQDESSQISFSKINVKGTGNMFHENPFKLVRRRTTLKQSKYEDPEDYDEAEMEEGVPIKEENFDFFQGLNDYYSPFTNLIKHQNSRMRKGRFSIVFSDT